MADRREKLQTLRSHPWLSKLWLKLTEEEVTIMELFADLNYRLDNGEWENLVHRLWMDQPDVRPKHWKEIMELLICSSEITFRRRHRNARPQSDG